MTLAFTVVFRKVQIEDLTNAFVKNLHMPYKFAFMVLTSCRFIPIFMKEMKYILEAQKARGIEIDTKNPLKKVGLILPLSMPLLIGSVSKIEFAALSAETRGFHLRTRKSGLYEYPFHAIDWLFLLLGLLLIGLVCLFNQVL
jgi:energy-coupling factor transport system permease protein